MQKRSVEEIKELMVYELMNCSNIYFETTKSKTIDKQVFAWFHLGVFSALKFAGYEEKDLYKALTKAQKELKKVMAVDN